MAVLSPSNVPAGTPPAAAAHPEVAAAPAPRGRATWSGLVRLRLLAFPVKAYPVAVSAPQTPCHQLHAGCGQRLRYEKQCPVHGPVDAGAVARGYFYAPDQYVLLDEAALDQLRPAQDKALVLDYCLDPARVDPLLFSGRSLYLLPDGPAAHPPYDVLAQALQDRHQGAVGRVVLSGQRHLALLRPAGRVLTLHVLHFPAQLRARAPLEADLRAAAVSDEERTFAGLLLEASSPAIVPWATYHDDTADQLAALVEATLRCRQAMFPA